MPDRISYPDTKKIKVDELSVVIANSTEQLAQNAADLAREYLQSLLKQQDTVSIILATGNSQLEFLDVIALWNDLDWSRIILFHLDEYSGISAEHPGSFRYYLHHQVERRVQPGTFNYIQGDALQPKAECSRYSQLLQQQKIDLCMLGIGDNGHLAFNEPSVADFNDSEVIKLVRLETKTRQQQVDGGYFTDLAAVPKYAYTLTIPTICDAKKNLLSGGGKPQSRISATDFKRCDRATVSRHNFTDSTPSGFILYGKFY